MKLIIYHCDICKDVVREGRPGPDVRPFVAFEFYIMASHALAGDRFAVKEPAETEHHICHLCLAGLVAMAKEVRESGWDGPA